MLPDGNGEFTRKMGMLVDDQKIEKLFIEPDLKDNPPGVPLEVSGAETMLSYLRTF
jgi:peroxiredoxin